ncbi:MAG: DUF4296 domain-containing protein [Bacteroidales bacterium]|nr:DUF4296 domain-containing protein [Bacteroidales bacterium]
MKPFLIFFFLLIITVSCNSGKSDREDISGKPQQLLSEEKMADVITDIRLTEAAISQLTSAGAESPEVVADFYYRKLFEKHQITSEILRENLDYYSKDPQIMHEILAQVVNNLTEVHTEVSTQK